MIEKVNPSHPDKVADRIAGAIVDLAYKKQENPKIAVEVLIGHGKCLVIAETSVKLDKLDIYDIVWRIAQVSEIDVAYHEVPQDEHLAENQAEEIRCGDNGIFKGVPVSREEEKLSTAVRALYQSFPTDGKFIYDESTGTVIACQSNAFNDDIYDKLCDIFPETGCFVINPLGEWTGGTDVDTGATNRKLGSDMGRAVTGGGLHGKDLSKADVAVNIVCHMMAQDYQQTITALCAIGDDKVAFRNADGITTFIPYAEVVERAGEYINDLGGFEKLAEWGLF